MAHNSTKEQMEFRSVMSDLLAEVLDKKLQPYLQRVDSRFQTTENDITVILKENKRLKLLWSPLLSDFRLKLLAFRVNWM